MPNSIKFYKKRNKTVKINEQKKFSQQNGEYYVEYDKKVEGSSAKQKPGMYISNIPIDSNGNSVKFQVPEEFNGKDMSDILKSYCKNETYTIKQIIEKNQKSCKLICTFKGNLVSSCFKLKDIEEIFKEFQLNSKLLKILRIKANTVDKFIQLIEDCRLYQLGKLELETICDNWVGGYHNRKGLCIFRYWLFFVSGKRINVLSSDQLGNKGCFSESIEFNSISKKYEMKREMLEYFIQFILVNQLSNNSHLRRFYYKGKSYKF